MELSECSALIAGGAGGFGSATARRLVQRGISVVVFDPAYDRAKALADELGSLAIAVGGNVDNDADVSAAIDAATGLGNFAIAITAHGGVSATPRILSD